MWITSVSGRDVFSFAEFELELGRGLTVVTGPNGAGKSNVGRLLQLCRTAVRSAVRGDLTELTREYSRAGRFAADRFHVKVGIEFDEPAERLVIEQWARAAFLTTLAGSDQMNAVSRAAVLPHDLNGADALAGGVLTVAHDASFRRPWRIKWRTEAGEVDLLEHRVGHPDAPNVTPLEWLRERRDPLAAPALAETRSTITLAELFTAGRFELTVRPTGIDPEPAEILAAYQAVGAELDASRNSLGLAHVLDHLLTRGLLLSDQPGDGELAVVPLHTLTDPHTEAAGEASIGARLLRRKTGDLALRAAFEKAHELFRSLSAAELDVIAQAIRGPEPEGWTLTATPVVPTTAPDGSVADIPLRMAGRGRIEAARLALTLTDPTHTVLLDEPATALSAVAQRRLLTHLLNRSVTRQAIVITHSAHLVPATPAGRILRLTPDPATGATVVHQVPEDVAELHAHGLLLGDSEIRDALFAAAVWLVEGPTEAEALRIWLADLGGGLPTPQSAHVLILPVGSDTSFPRYADLMAKLGIPHAILADGPALRPDGPLKQLPGAPGPTVPDTFPDRRAAWASAGVRTLAEDYYHEDPSKRGEIEAFFNRTDPQTWVGIKDRSKIRRGAVFAARVSAPEEIVQLWRDFLADVGLA